MPHPQALHPGTAYRFPSTEPLPDDSVFEHIALGFSSIVELFTCGDVVHLKSLIMFRGGVNSAEQSRTRGDRESCSSRAITRLL